MNGMIYDCAPIVDTKIGDLPAGIGLYSDTWATSSASSATVALLRAVFSALCAAPSAAAGAPADADAAADVGALAQPGQRRVNWAPSPGSRIFLPRWRGAR